MGLGKTLMSITLLWTLLNQGFSSNNGTSAVRKVVVVCPTSLVGNWDNEIRKWVGEHCPTFAVKTDPKRVIKTFLQHRGKGVLIVSYETQRLYSKLFENAAKQNMSLNRIGGGSSGAGAVTASAAANNEQLLATTVTSSTSGGIRGHSNNGVCDLMICDEAHKLKNADSGLARALNLLPARKRILLSGTPMQNELTEFFNMVNFCNPGVLGSNADFKRRCVPCAAVCVCRGDAHHVVIRTPRTSLMRANAHCH
jgi:DNA repair and recombination RAD54-like protein